MPLGWIDFSKSERNKVLSVLDQLSEPGTLDELGIAPIRDGYANIFFPGTSTIQTRAKYFMIVPYALKDLEYSSETNPHRALRTFDEMERKCAEALLSSTEDSEGIIGSRSLSQNRWVKRTPADIYWAGLRNYGIFNGGTASLSEYILAMCSLKSQKRAVIKLGNSHDNAEKDADVDKDDKDAPDLFKMQFWKIPTYHENWNENLNIDLTEEEGLFLRNQIIHSYPESMLAFILQNNLSDIFTCKNFQEMNSLIHLFPEQVQDDYAKAYSFSKFLLVLRTIYNMIVSDGQNEKANAAWDSFIPYLSDYATVDLDSIFSRLKINSNTYLFKFLRTERSLMMENDLEGMKTEIKRRERELKQSRAKTMHPGELDPDAWFGGFELDYRFGNAKTIIRDIFESEGVHVKSEQ